MVTIAEMKKRALWKSVLAILLSVVMVFTLIPMLGLGRAEAAAKVPPRVAKVKLINAVISGKKANAMTLSWGKAKNAKNYQVYRFQSKWSKYKTVKGCSASVAKLKYGKTYKFKVRAINGKKKGKFSKVVRVVVQSNGKMTTYDSRGKKQVKPMKAGDRLVMLAKKHVGGVYKLKGKHLKNPKKKGDKNIIDCTGFIQAIYKKYANISLPPGSHKKMIKAALKRGKKIKTITAAQAGDLLFYNPGTRRQHVAICVGDEQVIDATKSLNGVRVHYQNSQKPTCIVRVLSSGGKRQHLTEAEITEIEIAKIDKALNKMYKKKGISLPDKKYTILNFFKNNKSLISWVESYKGNLSISFHDKVLKSRAKYLKKLKLPAKPKMQIDNNGKVTLTGNIENYYRILIAAGWLTTGNKALEYDIPSVFRGVKSIVVKNGKTYVNTFGSDANDNRQIIFNGTVPVKIYCGCKEGEKYIVSDSYPMVMSSMEAGLAEDEYEDEPIGVGVSIIEVGKALPVMYDSYGDMEDYLKYQGMRTAPFKIYGASDGSKEISFERYRDKSQNEYISDHTLYAVKYDEDDVRAAYNEIKKKNGKIRCMDGTTIGNYDEFKKLCSTGMNPFTSEMKKLFESVPQKGNGYFATFY